MTAPSRSSTRGRTPAVAPAGLLGREELRVAIRREQARVRGGGEFAVVLFRVKAAGPKGRSLLPANRLAGVLLRAAGEADAVGWFDKRHLCVVMPGISAAAAGVSAARVCDAMARGGGPRPRAVACGYPGRTGSPLDRMPVV